MAFTMTVNGTLGQSSSSFARQVFLTLGAATGECEQEFHQSYLIRKDSIEIPKPPDTVLPIAVAVPLTEIRFLAVRAVNSAQVSLHYTEDGDTPVEHVIPVQLGQAAHPEGLFLLFGGFPNLTLTIDSVEDDKTQIEIWAAGK